LKEIVILFKERIDNMSENYYTKADRLLKQLDIQLSDKKIVTIKDIIDSNNFSGISTSTKK
jgi:hypoxanthine-guanine phosphoribosyltransferase